MQTLTIDAEPYIDLLDNLTAMSTVQAYKARTYQALRIREGARLLDVGCGVCDDARALAVLVGWSGQVVGVDCLETMIAEARRRTAMIDLTAEFRVEDAERLTALDGTFDGCRADRALQHMDNPARALAEMVRVTRPGGRIVVSEPDWETVFIDAPDRALTRRILNFRCDTIRHGWIGRRLPNFLDRAGLADIAITPVTVWGTDYAEACAGMQLPSILAQAQEGSVLSQVEADGWVAQLMEASRDGRFFGGMTVFIVSGRKP